MLGDPLVVVGLMTSVVLPVVLVLFTSQGVTIGVLVGLVGFMLTLQLEAAVRANDQRRLERQRSRVLDAIEREPSFAPTMARLVESAAVILGGAAHAAFVDLARERLGELSRLLGQMEAGEVDLRGHLSINQAIASSSTRSIKGVSVLDRDVDLHWWSAPEGVEYARRNYRAADDGVEVCRIFVHDGLGEEAERIVAEQADHGIEVLTVQRSLMPRNLIRNIALFDDAFLIETFRDSNDVVSKYTSDPAKVARAVEDFRRIQEFTTPYVPGVTRPGSGVS